MGLTVTSTGVSALDSYNGIVKNKQSDKIIALAGNPNVGKSTVFNQLTGMNQHTGNWPGKTVAVAQGYCTYNNDYLLVDLPGTYSLMANSVEEEVARDFLCFGAIDVAVVVCDATCLERNLNLVLQAMEITENVVVCINLMDEAAKKGIEINLDKLSEILGAYCVGTSARSNKGLLELVKAIDYAINKPLKKKSLPKYTPVIESAIKEITPSLPQYSFISQRWLALRLLEGNKSAMQAISSNLAFRLKDYEHLEMNLINTVAKLEEQNISQAGLQDKIISCIIITAEGISLDVVTHLKAEYNARDRALDKIFTGKYTGFPIMLLLLSVIFYLTIIGANYPSQMLSSALLGIEKPLFNWMINIGINLQVADMLVHGMYRVLAWIIAVMLPPMAIFFPLFTLLEDSGYLPRIAFNLDKYYQKCNASGKQSLCQCMSFGCNAAGIIGCRIIDSPRERLIAIITNNFIPCNGRFPTLIAIITMFFIGFGSGFFSSIGSTLMLTGIIVLGVLSTFVVSKILSKTLLKGVPSSFTLELPPYRRPQIGNVIVRSIFDRTLFVLGRAIMVAAPAGIFIWFMANISIEGISLLSRLAQFLDPFAKIIGLDGIILTAFILGLPANEIVIPIIIMAYMSTGSLIEMNNLEALRQLLISNGWTWVTALCTMLFSLMHWPCTTALLTIKKETGSLKWTVIAFLVPTVCGITVCFVVNMLANLFFI